MILVPKGHLFIVRRGSVNTPPDMLARPNDFLSSDGHAQTLALGGMIKYRINYLLDSQQNGDRQSARNIAQGLPKRPSWFYSLYELQEPVEPQWLDCTSAEFQAAGGNYFGPNPNRPGIVGETQDQFMDRIKTGFTVIVDHVRKGENVIAVAHKLVAEVAEAFIFRQDLEVANHAVFDEGTAHHFVFNEAGYVLETRILRPTILSGQERR